MFKKGKKKDKRIQLFAVVEIIDSEGHYDSNAPYITIAESFKECAEYIDNREFLDNVQHYTMWCELRKIDPNLESSWEQYKEIVLPVSKYGVINFYLFWKDIIATVRMFNGCAPIGCSFDREVEKRYLMDLCQMKKNTEEQDTKESIVN